MSVILCAGFHSMVFYWHMNPVAHNSLLLFCVDSEEELKVAMCEMNLYSVPRAMRPHQQHYDPSAHHTPPVKWTRHISRIEKDQFADAEA